MSALTSFIGGLGKLDEQGESTVLVLEDLSLIHICALDRPRAGQP